MAKRKIPELTNTNSSVQPSTTIETAIVHATAIMRHGARTPWGNTLNCWEDYWTNPATAIWDCNLTAYLSPPPPAHVTEEGANAGNDQAMFLFEKRYDALVSSTQKEPPSKSTYLSNFLNGTCQVGQLLLQGYKQELINGQFLRQAYVYNNQDNNADASPHNPRMKLLDVVNGGVNKQNNEEIWDRVYYRVDDEARTLMSGQVILRGLLGPEMDAYFAANQRYPVIPLHTADYDRDILDPNEKICPRLTEMRTRNEQSMDYKLRVDQTHEANILRKFQHDVLKVPQADQDMDAIDCLMTTMCTDRPLPDAVNDFRPDYIPVEADEEPILGLQQAGDYGTNLLSRLFTFDAEKYTYNLKANDAEYAKLGIQPLWYEIMEKIQPHLERKEHAVKMSVFSGHDTTIMPLLVALDSNLWDDKDWPPYASMIVLEIHEVTTDHSLFPSKFAFRLVYNGNVLTNKISDCPPDLQLCDVNVLLERIGKFATVDAECGRQELDPVEPIDPVARTQDLVSTPEGLLYLAVLVGVSAFFGGLLTCLCLTGGSLPRCRRRGAKVPSSEEDGIALTSSALR